MRINKAVARADFKAHAAKDRREADLLEQGAARFREQGNASAAKDAEALAKVYRQRADNADNYKFPNWVE